MHIIAEETAINPTGERKVHKRRRESGYGESGSRHAERIWRSCNSGYSQGSFRPVFGYLLNRLHRRFQQLWRLASEAAVWRGSGISSDTREAAPCIGGHFGKRTGHLMGPREHNLDAMHHLYWRSPAGALGRRLGGGLTCISADPVRRDQSGARYATVRQACERNSREEPGALTCTPGSVRGAWGNLGPYRARLALRGASSDPTVGIADEGPNNGQGQ